MATATKKERTISFYEIVESRAGVHLRVQPFDFKNMLNGMTTAGINRRILDGPSDTLVGTVHASNKGRDLLLHRVKDQSEWLSVIDLTTGDWEELESQASKGYLDTTAVVFIPYGNVVALMLGATSAPSHKKLETYLNGLKFFGQKTLVVRPLLSKAEVDRLGKAQGANRIDIRIGAHKAASLAGLKGRLAKILRQANTDYGDMRVTVTISVPPGGARLEDRQNLLSDLVELKEIMPGSAEMARAKLVFADAGGEEHIRLTEFVEHHITAKRRVAAVDDNGNSIRLHEALSEIHSAAHQHESELRLAVDALD